MKIYALILVGITLLLIDSVAVKALVRSKERSKAYRLFITAAIATIITIAFFISFKAVLILVLTIIITTIYMKIRYRYRLSRRIG